MDIVVDSHNDIALAKLSFLLSNYSHQIIKENGDGQNLLRRAGLSSLINDYRQVINPNISHNGFKNTNPSFNASYLIDDILDRISNNQELLFSFIKEIFVNISDIEEDDLISINNYLEVLGYKLNIKEIKSNAKLNYYIFEYTLTPYTDGVLERQKDTSYLTHLLSNDFPDLLNYYEGAISNYGNAEYKSAIDNCRTLIELFFKGLDSNNKNFSDGMLEAANEKALKGTESPKLNKDAIFKYWLENRKGFNRYRLFYTTYSLMSGLGIHGEEVPKKEDALLCIRLTEDILLWYFQSIE